MSVRKQEAVGKAGLAAGRIQGLGWLEREKAEGPPGGLPEPLVDVLLCWMVERGIPIPNPVGGEAAGHTLALAVRQGKTMISESDAVRVPEGTAAAGALLPTSSGARSVCPQCQGSSSGLLASLRSPSDQEA